MLQFLHQIHLRRRVRTGGTQAKRRTPHVAATAGVVGVAAGVQLVIVVTVEIVVHGAAATAPGNGVVIVMATIAHGDVRRVVQRSTGRGQHLVGVMVGRIVRQGNRLGPFVENGRVRCRLMTHIVLGHV